ncbi:MAG: OmpH family outer membrane protein [Planctomycetota bacterium]|jgi:Skp family chaperone for outer membrane proteins|nr:OmpH family outer membrane protein [Planctomycetota bacterium]
MRSGERLFIYSGLALSIALGLGWRGIGSSAVAESANRFAPESAMVATCDVLSVVEKLNEAPRYREALDQMRTEIQGRLGKMGADADEVKKKLAAAATGSPEADALSKEFSAKNSELQAAYQKATADFDALATKQVGEAFKLASETAYRIARANGYNVVISSKTVATDFRSNNIPGALQEILARPVIGIDASADITAQVMKELKLDAAPTPATPAAAAQPTTAPAAAPTTPAQPK